MQSELSFAYIEALRPRGSLEFCSTTINIKEELDVKTA